METPSHGIYYDAAVAHSSAHQAWMKAAVPAEDDAERLANAMLASARAIELTLATPKGGGKNGRRLLRKLEGESWEGYHGRLAQRYATEAKAERHRA